MRWLISIGCALALFSAVILVFGKLLHDNEEANVDYIVKQKLKNQTKEPEEELVVERVETQEQQLQQVILDNLTCFEDKQCTLIALPGYSQSCLVAVNKIGANEIDKLDLDVDYDQACIDKLENSTAICQLNLCSF